MLFKNLLYALTCLSFSVVIGGAVYEHVAVVPQWTAAPPASLSMFQGEYGLNPAPFWMYIHPVTLVLFVVSIVLNWRTKLRRYLLVSFLGYVLVLAITFSYFVPNLIKITTSTYSSQVDPELSQLAATWEVLSLVRLGFLIVLAMVALVGRGER